MSTDKSSATNVLLIDDDVSSTKSLVKALQRRDSELQFIHCHTAQSGSENAKRHAPEVAIVDLSLDPQKGPDSGFQMISELLSIDQSIRVIVLTGHQSQELGVKALHHGAASFVQKPAEPDHLIALIRDSATISKLKRDFRKLSDDQSQISKGLGISTKSPAMQKVLNSAAFSASNLRPLLLVGETGTGKGVLARAIHDAGQKNAKIKGPFIRFQPSYLSSDLVASELFGHEKGAFTGADSERKGLVEESNGGTLFIDEVDELPHDVQVLLLNVLQEQVYRRLGSTKERSSHFRLIAATNRKRESLVEDNKLRRDFYHRIAHSVLEIPRLKDRPEDIPVLTKHFLDLLELKEKLGIRGISSESQGLLQSHPWPGNIRELQAIVEGAAYLAAFRGRHCIETEDLDISNSQKPHNSNGSFRDQVQSFELDLIRKALKKCKGNQSQAATLLQVDRTTLRRILKRNDTP